MVVAPEMRRIMFSKIAIFRYLLLVSTLLVPSTFAWAGSDDAPPWLKQAALISPPVYDKQVPAVVLLDEQTVTVYEDGRIETTNNYVVRILTSAGKGYANASASYLSNSGKVKEIHAWMIRPSGDIKRYSKDETADAISNSDDVYNELRVKHILGDRDALVGSVFGYTTTVEERSVFGEDRWLFQDRLPTVLSRYSLTVPTGWKISSKLFNHASFEPTVSGNTYVWELKDLKPIRFERRSPAIVNLVPQLVVGYVPPPGTSTALRSYSNWAEVSSWLSELHDPQVTLDDAIATKVKELTADSKTELDKIRAVGRYVQNIQYISIDIGLGKGNGMRPHSASQVFAKSYGDCKDKANLMRTMLKALHITAYPLIIYSGDRDYVRQEWASPGQFNHCIIAIKVSDDTQAPTIIQHPVLGRLLIFDATSDTTPVGDLPDIEQGSFALLIAGDKGGLLRMPVTPPEANLLERKAEVALSGDGSVKAEIHERFIGQSAVTARDEYRGATKPEFSTMIEGWVSNGATAAKVSKIEPTDNMNEGRFALDVEFTAPNYAQLMHEKLLVFRPAIVARSEFLAFNEPTRTQPIVLSSRAYHETVNITLPTGFDVDELPDSVKFETSFGSYSANYLVHDGKLQFTRSLTQNAGTISSDRYSEVKVFFERIRKAEQSPVVLAKK
jgi:transglutaminase-like putative cysteine protease